MVSPPRRKTNLPRARHSENGSMQIPVLKVSSTTALAPLVNTLGRSFLVVPSFFVVTINLVNTAGISRLCM
jgi:hypothetical protein